MTLAPLLRVPPGAQARASEGRGTPAVPPEYRGSWRMVRRAANPGSGGLHRCLWEQAVVQIIGNQTNYSLIDVAFQA